MAGLNRPWASRDDAVFWLWMMGMALGWSLALVAIALLAWGLLLQPALAWWANGRLAIVTDSVAWLQWLHVATLAEGVLGALLFAFLVWYCDGMLKGSGKAES